MAILLSTLYGRTWSQFGAVLPTCTVLALLLGLNVSTLGLVIIPRGSFYLIAEMMGLIVVLNIVYVAVFVALERQSLRQRGAAVSALEGT